MKNRKLAVVSVLSVGLAFAMADVTLLHRRQDTPSTLKVSTYNNFNEEMAELEGLKTLILDQAYRSGSTAVIPSFDSKALPAWASSEAALSVGRGAARGHAAWVLVSKAAAAPWRYQVPSTLAGKAFDSLAPSSTLVQVLNAPSH